ncbi:MAG: hypothetical protein IPK58_19145 [Acidobacteria bacterium]|nr:hypothetical protein [Acidobacteriota bacterium]
MAGLGRNRGAPASVPKLKRLLEAALPGRGGGATSASTGVVATDTDADRTLVTDQAGKQRISRTNGLWPTERGLGDRPGFRFIDRVGHLPGTAIAHGYRSAFTITIR